MTSETASSQAAAAAAALPEAQLTSAPAAAAVPPQPQSPVSLPPQPLTTAAVPLIPLPLSLLCLMLGTCGTPQSLDAAATATVSARQSAQRSDRSVTGKRRITDTAEAAESEWQEAEGGDRRATIRAYEEGCHMPHLQLICKLDALSCSAGLRERFATSALKLIVFPGQ